MTDVLKQVHTKRRSQRIQQAIFVSLLITIFITVGWLALQTQQEWDLSREQRHSLTDTSVELLKKIEAGIEFMVFMSNNPGQRENVRDLIGQYQKHHDNITLTFIDPNMRPDLTREYGIKRDGEIRLSIKTPPPEGEALAKAKVQSELLREVSETGISNALLRLSRKSKRVLLFIEGHGERNPFSPANHDLRQFATELSDKGFKIERFDISQEPEIPSTTRVVIIASPQLDYLPQEVERITQHLVNGGNLLWLSDPDGLKGLDSLLTTMGLSSPKGIVIDQGTQDLGIADASFSLISDYNQHPALQNFKVVSLFPQARIFEVLAQDSVWTQTPFLVTAKRTWLETETLQQSVSFDPVNDKQGPLHIGYSLVRELETGEDANEKQKQQRIILIGDGDFLSNRFLHNGANLPLGLNLLDWLSGEESFLNLRFTETPDTHLDLSNTTLAWIGLFFLFVLPGFCFILAARIWWKRRNS